jgi:hypothetical protein
MMVIGTALGGMWNWIDVQGLTPTRSLSEPRLFLNFADGGPIMQPLVQVQCSAHISNDSLSKSFNLPIDRLQGIQCEHSTTNIRYIPQNYTNISAHDLLSYPNNMYWAKLPSSLHDHTLTTGLLFIMPDDTHTRAVLPCSVLAHWVLGDIWSLPKTDRNIHQTIPNPLELLNKSFPTFYQVHKFSLLRTGGPAFLVIQMNYPYQTSCIFCRWAPIQMIT